ncbi:MAG: hypothetical protein SXV54_18710 [Chloroflexota bacterium]|nr:hypothetical protein [Chloroflexota bacterium]
MAGLLLVGAGGLLVLLAWPGEKRALTEELPAIVPTGPTTEPIVPTRTPARGAAMPTPAVAATPVALSTAPLPTVTGTLQVTLLPHQQEPGLLERTRFLEWLERPRWGVGVGTGPISRYQVGSLRLGWYLDWQAQLAPLRPEGAAYAQMIRLREGVLSPGTGEIAAIARANPGSLWLVGNEPDVKWQDNVEPATYARLYHDAYSAIKSADPTALVAIGGVSQPTPLRLRYLDMVLGAYQTQFGAEMEVDVWNAHNFILREERGSWGVDIPPGMPDDRGVLYEIEDGGSLEIFRQQIVDLRQWMAQRGYQDRPLVVSEYGILMPADYGFPPERVADFLTGTFDIFMTAADPALGYPEDDYRLVQSWCWYSLDAPADYYPTGNLFDPQTGAMTPVGEVWSRYVE